MGLFGGCYVTDGPEAQERHPVEMADLGNGSGFHIAGKDVRIEGFDSEVLFEGRYKLVSGADEALMDGVGALQAFNLSDQTRVGGEALRQTLHLASEIPFSAPYVVICYLGADNEVTHLQAGINASGHTGVDDAVRSLGENQFGSSTGRVDFAYSGLYHIGDSTSGQRVELAVHCDDYSCFHTGAKIPSFRKFLYNSYAFCNVLEGLCIILVYCAYFRFRTNNF